MKTLGKTRLQELSLDITKDSKLMAQQTIMLNRVEELPSASEAAKADDIELQDIMENTSRSVGDLVAQLNNQMHSPGDLLEHPLHELLGLDKELRSIRGLLKVETVKRFKNA